MFKLFIWTFNILCRRHSMLADNPNPQKGAVGNHLVGIFVNNFAVTTNINFFVIIEHLCCCQKQTWYLLLRAYDKSLKLKLFHFCNGFQMRTHCTHNHWLWVRFQRHAIPRYFSFYSFLLSLLLICLLMCLFFFDLKKKKIT